LNGNVTQHARVVLEDCRGALADLKDGVQGSEWRRGYASAVALLRAVGHVLKNVDAKASAEARNAIDAELRALKEHKAEYPIFWQFIEGERNNILKEYRFAAGQDVTVSLGGDPTTYAYPMKQGCFVGRDQREVIDEAIMFWEAHLKRVDARVHELERHSPHPLQSARR
jgi:hypothetical protein